jgi:preprotein translocase subunit YajC
MIIRPQNKRNAQISDMISKLEKGSEVIAASGILGKVKEISGAYVSIEIGENNIIKLQKSSIANILPKGTIDAIK